MLKRIVIPTIIVLVMSYFLEGVQIDNYWKAVLFIVVNSVINFFIRPMLRVISLPLNILTLGSFSIIISTILILFADYFVEGFYIDGFWNALLMAIVFSVFV